MEINGWKVTAIIFIILFALETLLIVYSVNEATKDEQRELDCSELCTDDSYVGYYYEPVENKCYCSSNGEDWDEK